MLPLLVALQNLLDAVRAVTVHDREEGGADVAVRSASINPIDRPRSWKNTRSA
jgi:hypothetical protein